MKKIKEEDDNYVITHKTIVENNEENKIYNSKHFNYKMHNTSQNNYSQKIEINNLNIQDNTIFEGKDIITNNKDNSQEILEYFPSNNKLSLIDINQPRSLYKVKMVYDSLSEEEIICNLNSYERKIKESHLINVKSYSFFFYAYFFFRFLIIISYFIFFLYCFSFNPLPIKTILEKKYSIQLKDNSLEAFYFTLSILLDIFFCLLFIIEIFKDYETEDGIRFSFEYKIIDKNCFRLGIFFDLLVTFPFYSLITILIINSEIFDIKDNSFPNIVRNDIFIFNSSKTFGFDATIHSLEEYFIYDTCFGKIIYLCLFRIFSLIKLNDLLNLTKEIFDLTIGTSLLIHSSIYLFYVHAASCIWINIGKFFSKDNSWVFENDLKDESNFYLYIYSLYFNVTTVFTVGYGDISPHSIFEYAYTNIILLISCSIYSTMISAISSKFTESESKKSIFQKKKELLEKITSDQPIPEVLKNKILNHFKNNSALHLEEKRELLDTLPFSIKNELLLGMYWLALEKLVFFNNCNKEIKGFMLNFLKPLNLEKNEVLYSVGATFDEIFFVLSGELHFLLGFQKKYYKFFWVQEKDSFGEISVHENENIDYEVRSKNKVITKLLCLHKDDVEIIKNHYPNVLKIKMKEALKKYLEMKSQKKLTYKVITNKINQSMNFNQTKDNLFSASSIYQSIISKQSEKSTKSNKQKEILNELDFSDSLPGFFEVTTKKKMSSNYNNNKFESFKKTLFKNDSNSRLSIIPNETKNNTFNFHDKKVNCSLKIKIDPINNISNMRNIDSYFLLIQNMLNELKIFPFDTNVKHSHQIEKVESLNKGNNNKEIMNNKLILLNSKNNGNNNLNSNNKLSSFLKLPNKKFIEMKKEKGFLIKQAICFFSKNTKQFSEYCELESNEKSSKHKKKSEKKLQIKINSVYYEDEFQANFINLFISKNETKSDFNLLEKSKFVKSNEKQFKTTKTKSKNPDKKVHFKNLIENMKFKKYINKRKNFYVYQRELNKYKFKDKENENNKKKHYTTSPLSPNINKDNSKNIVDVNNDNIIQLKAFNLNKQNKISNKNINIFQNNQRNSIAVPQILNNKIKFLLSRNISNEKKYTNTGNLNRNIDTTVNILANKFERRNYKINTVAQANQKSPQIDIANTGKKLKIKESELESENKKRQRRCTFFVPNKTNNKNKNDDKFSLSQIKKEGTQYIDSLLNNKKKEIDIFKTEELSNLFKTNLMIHMKKDKTKSKAKENNLFLSSSSSEIDIFKKL